MRDHAIARSLAFVMVMAIALMPIQAAVAQEDRESVREGSGSQGQGRGSQSAALVLPLSGNVTSGGTGTFRGTLSVQRFARKANQIVAVGLITGTLAPAGGPVGTLVYRHLVEIPVTLTQAVAGVAPSGAVRPVRYEAGMPRIILAQATCGVLNLELGAITINALGLTITTNPIVLDISGDTAGPLGNVVCQILTLLGTVGNVIGLVVNLLNTLLGLLGGLTGGLAI